MPISYPAAQDTFSDEQNVVYVDSVPTGGTFTDANKQNRLYDVTEELQAVVGYSGDAAAAVGSHTAQLKYLLAGGGAALPQGPTFAPAPADGQLQILTSEDPMGFYRWEAATAAWHLLGADARHLMTKPLPDTLPTAGQTLVYDAGAGHWTYAVGMANPMTTTGDVIVAGAGGAPTRLGVGANGQVLTLVGGVPAWGAAAMANPMTNVGDLIVGGTGGAATRLPFGTDGQWLRMSGTSPAWVTTAVLTNPMTTAGDLIYSSDGLGTPARLGLGANGTVLGVSAGALTYVAAASNPMTAVGDLILGGASGATTRLPIGSSSQVLTVSGGTAVWAAATGGMTNPMTAAGDVIIGGSSGTPTRLAAGTAGYVLTMVSGSPAWAAATGGGMTNPMTTAGDLIYGGTSGAPSRLGIGTNSHVLTSNGSQPQWQAPPWLTDPMTTTGDIIYRASGGTTRLGIGSTNQVLTVISGVPSWQTPAAGGGGWTIGGNTVGANGTVGSNDNFRVGIETNNITRMTFLEGSSTQTQIWVNGVKEMPSFVLQCMNIDGADQENLLLWENYEASGTHRTRQMQIGAVSTSPAYAAYMRIGLNQGSGQGDTTGADYTTDVLSMSSQGKLTHGGNLAAGWPAWLYTAASSNGAAVDHLVENTYNASATASSARYVAKVGGTTCTGDPYASFQIPSGTSWGVGVDNSDRDLFQIYQSDQAPGTTPRVAINSQGNVGLGTLEMSGKLDVQGSVTLGSINLATKTGSKSGRTVTLTSGTFSTGDIGRIIVWADGTIARIIAYTSTTTCEVMESGTVGSQTLSVIYPTLYMDATVGQVGLSGASLTGASFGAHGVFLAGGAYGNSVVANKSGTAVTATTGTFAAADVGRLLLWADSSIDVITAYTDSTHVTVSTSSTKSGLGAVTESAVLFAQNATGGKVGIGTTNPQQTLHLASGSLQMSGYGAGTLSTDANGLVTASSDERLKTIVGPYERGLAALAALTPICYRWRDGRGHDAEGLYAGLGAANVQAHLPEAVGRDADGYLTLQDRPLIAALVNAVNELAGRLVALEAAHG